MDILIYKLICRKCNEENRILFLNGSGAYHCNKCDAVIMDTEIINISETFKGMGKLKNKSEPAASAPAF